MTRLGQGVAFLTPARQRLHSGRRLNGQHRRSALPARAAGPLTAGPLTAAPGLLRRGREAARGARQEAAVGAGRRGRPLQLRTARGRAAAPRDVQPRREPPQQEAPAVR